MSEQGKPGDAVMPREQPMGLTEEQVEEFVKDTGRNCRECSNLVFLAACVDCMLRLAGRIAQAAAQAERERCARLAEAVKIPQLCSLDKLRQRIAASIRGGRNNP